MISPAHPPSPRTQSRPDDGLATHVIDLTPPPSGPRPAAGHLQTAVAVQTPAPRLPVNLSASEADDDGPAVVFPKAGDEFLDFRLEGELGRGAFGRVYLARQGELAGRLVALKVTTKASVEPQTLAQLQHTNIVPVYSVHRHGPLQAVCMPYYGSVTLDDVVGGLRSRERVPGSGDHFVSTLNQRRASTTPGPASGGGPPSDPEAVPAVGVPRAVSTNDILSRLSKFSYTHAVLWVGARLADGLAHAHDRGVIHRDLKPANVLLTDEGQPMLLDFNLADDANAEPGGTARVGGTLPYMSPEQLEVFRTRKGKVDARSDLYSLGQMLYELLAGRHPFPTPTGAVARILPKMIADRRAGPPPLRKYNRSVTPAVEAIVRKCLEPDPAKRYQSARALREDIERHLADKPLLHTREPSLRERFRKFARRNPRLTSSGAILGLSAVLVLGLVGGLYAQHEQSRRRKAADGWEQFKKEKERAEVSFGLTALEPDRRPAALAEAERLLAGYGLPDDPAWAARPAVALLPDTGRAALRIEMGELLLFAARATAEPAAARDRLVRAQQMNDLAIEYFQPNLPQPVEVLRDELTARLAGKPVPTPGPFKPRSPVEAYLWAAGLAACGEYEMALDRERGLGYVVQQKPKHFAAQFLRGNCLAALGRAAEAEAAYSVCVALAPDEPLAYRYRGRARLRLDDFHGALADFNAVLLLRQDADGFLDRAAAYWGLQEQAKEAADLTAARQLGAAPARR
jgi:serine/threonine protein kinase